MPLYRLSDGELLTFPSGMESLPDDLGDILRRNRNGDTTLEDRLALIELANKIELDVPRTGLMWFADVLRQMADA